MWYGMRLQSLREHSGLTRDDLSSRSGLSRSTIAKIEAGITIPSIDQFICLANSFRLRLPKLLMEAGVIRAKDMAAALAETRPRGARHAQKSSRSRASAQ